MEAPEKIWMTDEWVRQFDCKYFMAEDSIEYTRTDAFIEKACEWLSKHAKKYYFNKEGHYLGTDELVEDFKLLMES